MESGASGGTIPSDAVAAAIAAERLRIVAGLIKVTGDWDLAEDCLQDAAERALDRWPRDGVPDNPAAWITTTARRRAVDVLRRRETERTKVRELQVLAELEREVADAEGAGADGEPESNADAGWQIDGGPHGAAGSNGGAGQGGRTGSRDDAHWQREGRAQHAYDDDRMKLLFTCAHPALPMAGRVALTLKTVAGLSTREIARAFLVSEATMSQRLLRTRNKIEHAGISFRVPQPHRLADRVGGVLAVIYLVFNEGYTASAGETFRDELAAEAIQLAGLVTQLLPFYDEVHGLRALLLLQHARRAARSDSVGDLVPMEEQDRTRWDESLIAAGLESLATARATGRPPGYYRLQAEIAAIHMTAPDASTTDWARIVMVYDALVHLRPSPILALNRAIAIGFRDGPEAGLSALAEAKAAGGLADYPLLLAARADLLRRAGQHDRAATAYAEASRLARTDAERRFLQRRLRDLD